MRCYGIWIVEVVAEFVLYVSHLLVEGLHIGRVIMPVIW